METKICNNCESEKNISEYFKDSSLKSGYRGICKSCVKLKNYKHNLQKTTDNDRTCTKYNILKPMKE